MCMHFDGSGQESSFPSYVTEPDEGNTSSISHPSHLSHFPGFDVLSVREILGNSYQGYLDRKQQLLWSYQ